jgi:hypothetical protein
MKNKEKILKVVREKLQVTYKSKPIRITAEFLNRNLKSKEGIE